MVNKTMKELQEELSKYEQQQKKIQDKIKIVKADLMLFSTTGHAFDIKLISKLPQDIREIILYYVYKRMFIRKRHQEIVKIGYFPTQEIRKMLLDSDKIQKIIRGTNNPLFYNVMTCDSKIFKLKGFSKSEKEFLALLLSDESINIVTRKIALKKVVRKYPVNAARQEVEFYFTSKFLK